MKKIHYQKGKKKEIAVIFSCPGRHEEIEGRPLAGNTGKNFEIFSDILIELGFPYSLNRENITITNSWQFIEYEEKTGRSEATISEIKGEKNLKRIYSEIGDIEKLIIGFGKNANTVLDVMFRNDKFKNKKGLLILQYPYHLSFSSLNRNIKYDYHKKYIIPAKEITKNHKDKIRIQKENTYKRIEFISNDVYNCIKKYIK